MTKLTLFYVVLSFDSKTTEEGKSYYQSCMLGMVKGTYVCPMLGSVKYRHPSLLLICSSVVDPHPQGEEVDQLASAQDGETHAKSHNASK